MRTGGVCYCYHDYSYGPSGCVYVMYADGSGEVRPTQAGGRLLTSSTTKLSSLLSASLPCERGERWRLDVLLCCTMQVDHMKGYTHRNTQKVIHAHKQLHTSKGEFEN